MERDLSAWLVEPVDRTICREISRCGVESECELVQVIVHMLGAHSALVRSQQPSFQQRNHAMRARKQVFLLRLMALHLAIMEVASQPSIGGPAIGSDRASRRDSLPNKPVQAGFGDIRDRPQADAADAISILFGGDDDAGFQLCLPPRCAGLFSAPVGLVDLDDARQRGRGLGEPSHDAAYAAWPTRLVTAQASTRCRPKALMPFF